MITNIWHITRIKQVENLSTVSTTELPQTNEHRVKNFEQDRARLRQVQIWSDCRSCTSEHLVVLGHIVVHCCGVSCQGHFVTCIVIWIATIRPKCKHSCRIVVWTCLIKTKMIGCGLKRGRSCSRILWM